MTATQPAPSTPPDHPTGPGSPWTPDPAPISQPTSPRYQPTVTDRANARRRLARHHGNPDRQAHATVGAMQAGVRLLVDHLASHDGCDRTCPLLGDEVRALVAASDAFDAVTAQRRGYEIRAVA